MHMPDWATLLVHKPPTVLPWRDFPATPLSREAGSCFGIWPRPPSQAGTRSKVSGRGEPGERDVTNRRLRSCVLFLQMHASPGLLRHTASRGTVQRPLARRYLAADGSGSRDLHTT